MDEFKKYLREHKANMDFDEPSDKLWNHIRKQQRSKNFFIIRYMAAACLLIFIISTIYIFTNNYKKTSLIIAQVVKTNSKRNTDTLKFIQNEPAAVTKKEIVVAKITPPVNTAKRNIRNIKIKPKFDSSIKEPSVAESFGEMQKTFAIIINMQLNKIKSTPLYTEDVNYFSVFKKEFQDLNIEEQGVKQELIQNGLNDIQIEKLINVYQQKIILLKRLQNEITKMNNHTPKPLLEKEKPQPTYINL